MAWSAGQLGGAAVPKGIHLAGKASDATSKSNVSTMYTFTSVSYGPEHASRELIITAAIGTSTTVSSFNIVVDGVTITDKVSFNPSSAGTMVIGRIAVPTGLSGTITLTTTSGTASVNYGFISVYRVVRKTSGNLSVSNTGTLASAGSPISVTGTAISSGGVLVGVGRSVSTGITIGVVSPSSLVLIDQFSIGSHTAFTYYIDGTSLATSTTAAVSLSFSPGATGATVLGSW